MPSKSLRKAFGPVAAISAFVVASLAVSYFALADGQQQTQERQASAALLEQRYNDRPRLRAVVAELNRNYSYDGYGNPVVWLLRNGISLELSAKNMPQGAMIQVFKYRLRINPFLRVQDQAMAVSRVIPYIEGQVRDGVPYGSGESFTVTARMLVPTGHPAAMANKPAIISP